MLSARLSAGLTRSPWTAALAAVFAVSVASAAPPSTPTPPTSPPAAAPVTAQTAPTDSTPLVRVKGGYHPSRIEVRPATATDQVTLRFLREEYTGCTLEVVFPTRGVRATLPPNTPVDVSLGALPPGEYPFHCGMKMNHGVLVVLAPEEAR